MSRNAFNDLDREYNREQEQREMARDERAAAMSMSKWADELLQIARDTGLRQQMTGVNAHDARAMLLAFWTLAADRNTAHKGKS